MKHVDANAVLAHRWRVILVDDMEQRIDITTMLSELILDGDGVKMIPRRPFTFSKMPERMEIILACQSDNGHAT